MKLLDTLAERDLLEETLILVVSDHGEEFLERGRWGHFEVNLYEEIVRVPMIIRDPDLPGPLTVAEPVSTLDIMPTVLDLAGCDAPEGMVGFSLVPHWNQERTANLDRVLISEMWRDHWHIIAVRTDAYKYIWNSRTPDAPRLYDLKQDPGELENIAAHLPEQTARFQAIVQEHIDAGAASAPGRAAELGDHDDEMIRRLRDLGYLE